MDPNKLTNELKASAARKTKAMLDGHTAVAPGTLMRAPDTGGPHVLVSVANLKAFADSIAVDIATGYAHRVVDEDHCADCGEELDAAIVFVLSNGRRLHPGCV